MAARAASVGAPDITPPMQRRPTASALPSLARSPKRKLFSSPRPECAQEVRSALVTRGGGIEQLFPQVSYGGGLL